MTWIIFTPMTKLQKAENKTQPGFVYLVQELNSLGGSTNKHQTEKDP
jgi:hypothetical protein